MLSVTHAVSFLYDPLAFHVAHPLLTSLPPAFFLLRLFFSTFVYFQRAGPIADVPFPKFPLAF